MVSIVVYLLTANYLISKKDRYYNEKIVSYIGVFLHAPPFIYVSCRLIYFPLFLRQLLAPRN